jgi:hypothetical protein
VLEFIHQKLEKEGREEVLHLTEEGFLIQGERRGTFSESQRGAGRGVFGGGTITF